MQYVYLVPNTACSQCSSISGARVSLVWSIANCVVQERGDGHGPKKTHLDDGELQEALLRSISSASGDGAIYYTARLLHTGHLPATVAAVLLRAAVSVIG